MKKLVDELKTTIASLSDSELLQIEKAIQAIKESRRIERTEDIPREVRAFYLCLVKTEGLTRSTPIEVIFKKKQMYKFLLQTKAQVDTFYYRICTSENQKPNRSLISFYREIFNCLSAYVNVTKNKNKLWTLLDILQTDLFQVIDKSYPGYLQSKVFLRMTGIHTKK